MPKKISKPTKPVQEKEKEKEKEKENLSSNFVEDYASSAIIQTIPFEESPLGVWLKLHPPKTECTKAFSGYIVSMGFLALKKECPPIRRKYIQGSIDVEYEIALNKNGYQTIPTVYVKCLHPAVIKEVKIPNNFHKHLDPGDQVDVGYYQKGEYTEWLVLKKL